MFLHFIHTAHTLIAWSLPRRLFRNVEEIEKLSELGVLFLLFEMGLELTIDKLRVSTHTVAVVSQTQSSVKMQCEVSSYRAGVSVNKLLLSLQALAKFIFGLGFLQMLVCSLAFTAMALPVGQGIMTQFLVNVLNVPASLAAIRSVDEAVVIAVALSLSSSAFVLQVGHALFQGFRAILSLSAQQHVPPVDTMNCKSSKRTMPNRYSVPAKNPVVSMTHFCGCNQCRSAYYTAIPVLIHR